MFHTVCLPSLWTDGKLGPLCMPYSFTICYDLPIKDDILILIPFYFLSLVISNNVSMSLKAVPLILFSLFHPRDLLGFELTFKKG